MARSPAAPPKRAGSFISSEYVARYGRKKHNGDEISTAMAAFCGSGTYFDIAKLVEVAAANELGERLKEWGDNRGKSNGMLRMLLGRQLRTRKAKGLDVVIGPTVIPGDAVEQPELWRGHAVPQPRQPQKSIAELLEQLGQPRPSTGPRSAGK